MKVVILRGGGFSGRVARTELDAHALPEPVAQDFAARVERAELAEQPENRPGRRWPDAQSYELCVEQSGSAVNCRFTEETLPENVRLLLAWVDGRPERVQSLE